jgi:RNA polymerase sigma-70 factor (ECF subfamily)
MVPTADSSCDRLLNRAAAGDQTAVNQLLAAHRDRLRQMVSVRIDHRLAGRVDPSDVVQDAMAEAFRRLPEYLQRRPIPFYPWLRQLAWNRLVDLYRFHVEGAKRAVGREANFAAALSDESVMVLGRRLIASGTSPSHNALRKELRQRVRGALTQLSEHYREVLVMRHLEQLTIKEIAAITGVTEGTVKSRLFRGMSQLHQVLDDQSFGTEI